MPVETQLDTAYIEAVAQKAREAVYREAKRFPGKHVDHDTALTKYGDFREAKGAWEECAFWSHEAGHIGERLAEAEAQLRLVIRAIEGRNDRK